MYARSLAGVRLSAPQTNGAGRPHWQGLLFVLVTVVLWAIGPLFVKHFSSLYNVWTQNACRYSFAAVMLLALGAARGHLGHRLTRVQWASLVLVTAANVIMQTFYAAAYYFVYPAVASLVGRVNILFIVLLSFFLFHDERRVIRSPFFITGAFLALSGVTLVIAGRDMAFLEHLDVSNHDFWIGIGMVVGFAFFVSVYALTIKHAVRDIPPLVCFTHVSWMTTLGLWVPVLILGGAGDLARHSLMPIGLMALSALLCIVIAHTCYYMALQSIKASVSASMFQLTPLVTCTFSAFLYGDRLTMPQYAGGAAVIAGAWLAAMAQVRLEEG